MINYDKKWLNYILYATVMIQFSVQGAYLLLLVQGRTLNGEGVLIFCFGKEDS